MELGISEAVDLTKKVADLIKKGATLEAQERIMELREAVLNVKDEVLSLQEENQKLRASRDEADAWRNRSANFKLTKTAGGADVYSGQIDGVDCYLCPACYDRKQTSILQDGNNMAGSFTCPGQGCGKHFAIKKSRDMGDYYSGFRR